MSDETHEKRREAYLDIALAEPRRCRIVNADQPEEKVAEDVMSFVEPLLEQLGTEAGRAHE